MFDSIIKEVKAKLKADEPLTIIDVREKRKSLQVNEKELDLCLVEALV